MVMGLTPMYFRGDKEGIKAYSLKPSRDLGSLAHSTYYLKGTGVFGCISFFDTPF